MAADGLVIGGSGLLFGIKISEKLSSAMGKAECSDPTVTASGNSFKAG
jgi:hypothetical protein